MKLRSLAPFGILAAGIAIGALIPSSLYFYGDANGSPYRVNRLSGVQQYPSDEGWITQRELDRRTEQAIAPEIARFTQRIAEMRIAERDGSLRKVEVMGRQVAAYYADGRKAEYYAIDTNDPRLEDAEAISGRLAARDPSQGATAGGGTAESAH